MPWTPDAWDDQKYAKAKRLLAEGQLSPGKQKEIEQKVAVYESREGLGDTDSAMTEDQLAKPPAPLESPKVAARTAQLQADVPAAGQTGYWTPRRPLGAMDFVPEDLGLADGVVGGRLAMWRDMPLEVWKERVAAPARQAAIAKGLQAKLVMQQSGGMVPPDQLPLLVQAMAEAQKAESTDLDAITEDDPAYKAFNDQQWQKAVQERAGNPEAGPIQRLEKLKTDKLLSAGNVAYGIEKGKDFAQAGLRGALDMASLGFGAGAMDALNEAVGGREAMQTQRDLQTAHPVASAAGAIGAGILSPLSGGPSLARALYSGAKPTIGKWGASAVAGGVTAAAEGLGKDVSQEAADALSDDPAAAQDQGRLEPGRLATNTAIRGGLGAAGGVAGEGLATAGRGLANAVSRSAIRGTRGRSPFEEAEAQGFEFGPTGVKVPATVARERELTRQTGVSWAERLGKKAENEVPFNIRRFAVGEKVAMERENLDYFDSVKPARTDRVTGEAITKTGEPVRAPATALNRELDSVLQDLEGVNPGLARKVELMVKDEFDPAMRPQQMAAVLERLSNMADAAPADTQTAKIMERLQAAVMEDMKGLPRGNLKDFHLFDPRRAEALEPDAGATISGWPALRQQHNLRMQNVETQRQLTGLRSPIANLPDDLAAMNANLAKAGKANSSVETEEALARFMPDELRREFHILRAANMVDDIGAPSGGPYPSRAGVLDWAGGKAKLAAYGWGRAVSKPLLPDNYPISPRFYSWLSARMPRAIVPGMNVAAEIARIQEVRNKPTPNVGDLTPEQKAFLQEILQ